MTYVGTWHIVQAGHFASLPVEDARQTPAAVEGERKSVAVQAAYVGDVLVEPPETNES